MRPLPEYEAQIDMEKSEDAALRAALALHDGDMRATIASLLADCAHLRRQLELTRSAMGRGFVRGWEPAPHRE